MEQVGSYQVRLLDDRILVKLEKPVNSRQGADGHTILYPEGAFGAENELQVWARVEQVGPGRWAKRKGKELGYRIPVDEVKVGDRVRVIWLLTKVETNRHLQQYLGGDRIVVRPGDILYVEEGADQPAH